MSGVYEIHYLQTAEKDLLDIFDYIKEDNPPAAGALLERIDLSISRLSEAPEKGVIPKDDRIRNLGYRILVVDKYFVFYVIREGYIQARRVLHGARKYEFLF